MIHLPRYTSIKRSIFGKTTGLISDMSLQTLWNTEGIKLEYTHPQETGLERMFSIV